MVGTAKQDRGMISVCDQPALPLSHTRGSGAVSPSGDTQALRAWVQPCVIDGEPCYIHERGLQRRDPQAYGWLARLARESGVHLREDRRNQQLQVHRDRRSRWPVVLVLILSAVADVAVVASEVRTRTGTPLLGQERRCSETVAVETRKVSVRSDQKTAVLGLISPAGQRRCEPASADARGSWADPWDWDFGVIPETGLFERVRAVLHAHHQAKPDDPYYVKTDLDRIAAYYSRFPEAVQLLSSLEGKAWRLSYGKGTWVTKATGTRVRVTQATVVFDPRMAAQLRFHRACSDSGRCIVSPADALLHELLHVRSMLLNSRRFIAQGGMTGVLYPYAHEAEIIQAENALYSSMAKLDGRARPQRPRHKHVGKLVRASCALCIN